MYAQRSHSIKMCEFLAAVAPVRTKGSEQLLSTDTHSGTSSYKFTYSVEIAPVCKDDLVCLPTKLARSLANINQLVVCTRISGSIQVVDPVTLQVADIPSNIYWRDPFPALASVTDLIEFLVLDIEPAGPVRGKYVLADAQICFANNNKDNSESDNDGIFHTRTHLGNILQPGDTVLGFFLARANFNDAAFESLDADRIPDVMLVKKTYPNRRKKNKARNWKLKSIAVEAEDVPGEGADKVHGRGAIGRLGGRDQQRVERDYELFLRELEEDPELRSSINLYKAEAAVAAARIEDMEATPTAKPGAGSGMAGGKKRGKKAADAMDEDMDGVPVNPPVPAPKPDAPLVRPGEFDGGDSESEEEDFPDVELDELLAEFDTLAVSDNEDGPDVAAEGAEDEDA